MDEQEEVQQNNMISNLPLLFANGYPTSLDKITETQLENFIPFMVQCSLGHINLQGKEDCSEPEWWPEDLPFTIPLSKPKKFNGNWIEKMKEVVLICYQFHKSVFLLRFCTDLASYEHASLRFINNYNSTTSLFDRRSNKLLVTFRNENMSYDQPQRSRKCLLQQKSKNDRHAIQELEHMMVEPAPFDIYLCDNCDAELYSKEAILEHEKTCNVDDDDVILCDTPEPLEDNQPLNPLTNTENNELCIKFLLNFNLQHREENKAITNVETVVAKEESGFMIVDRNKRMPRRNRAVHSLTRCPTIPLSSPAGQLLLRTTKTVMPPEYLTERLDRMERFCQAPILSKLSNKPKYLEKKHTPSNPHCTFKKPQENSTHMFVFPRRQFSQRRRTENFIFLNSPLIRRCRPISVRLKKITEQEMKGKRSSPSTKLNIKLTRDTTRSSNWKISSRSTEIIVDTIDLCSSDDDEPSKTNYQPEILQAQSTAENYSPKTVLAASTSKANFSKNHLKKIRNRLNSSEVSLIPIPRTQINKSVVTSDKSNKGTSLIKVVPTTTSGIPSNSTTKSLYEGNILLSSSSAVTADSGIVFPKPLRPSIYIFSNYTPSLAAVMSTSNEIVSAHDNTSSRVCNQVNNVQSDTDINIVTKHASIASTSSKSDWFVGTNTGAGSSNQSLSNERERVSRNMALVQSFGSPVSIDLTS